MPHWASAWVRLFGTCLFLVTIASGQSSTTADPSASRPTSIPFSFLGNYGASGRFKSEPGHNCRVSPAMVPNRRPAEVPPWIDLHYHTETSIYDVGPTHAIKRLDGASRSIPVLQPLARLAYGREPVLDVPRDIVVDSKHRLIVTDPGIPAVHVLGGKQSFRIEGGGERRLQQPNSVAVDGNDNIYISDGKTGLIDVYDSEGRFLRSFGTFRGEPIFQEPNGIAVHGNRLFVLDSPVHELVVMDLEGNIIRRVGGHHHLGGVTFVYPSEIAVQDSRIAVLDLFGSRVQILGLKGTPIRSFPVGAISRGPRPPAIGFALDTTGNVYLSNDWPDVRVYRPDGTLLGVVDNCGTSSPGIWVDSANHLYLADPMAARIKVLQLSNTVQPQK